MNIAILGPQMSGKGTQADLLEQKYGFTRIETGKILRQIATSGHPRSKDVARMQQTGVLVSNDIVNEILTEVLQQNVTNGFLLDGSPRTSDQYYLVKNVLGQKGQKIDWAIFINISEEEILKRISGRRVCAECGSTYNLVTGPKPIDGRCVCGGELKIRNDDTPEATKNRLVYYKNDILSVVDLFRMDGNLIEIDGEQSIEAIHEEIVKKLGL